MAVVINWLLILLSVVLCPHVLIAIAFWSEKPLSSAFTVLIDGIVLRQELIAITLMGIDKSR